MNRATFRMHGDLAVFLRREHRERESFEYAFAGEPSLKDTVEAIGVPHPEIDAVLVNGAPVDLSVATTSGATVDVYGWGATPDTIAPPRRLIPAPPETRAFVLDTHLGGLAALLRMLGFDVRWSIDTEDAELAAISAAEERILLTRDIGLLKRSIVVHGRFVRANLPKLQAREILDRYDLRPRAKPFTRCLRCNTRLRDATPAEVADRVPPRVRAAFTEYRECPGCRRVYWAGTHHERMAEVAKSLLEQPPGR